MKQSLITLGLLCVIVGCSAPRSISFIPPEGEYAVRGNIISRSLVLKEWSSQIAKKNNRLYLAVERAALEAQETSQPIHVYRSLDTYYTSNFCNYNINHVLTVDRGQLMFNHYSDADGPSISECASRLIKSK